MRTFQGDNLAGSRARVSEAAGCVRACMIAVVIGIERHALG